MDREARRPSPRTLTAVAVVALLLALAVAGLVRSAGADGPVTDGERAAEVAASLRCPTCQGLSVADSNSPLSKSMRRIIDEQVAAGRSSAEIRGYFVDRYGEWVLLSPRAEGTGWLVWALPLAAVAAGLAAVTMLVRRRRDPASTAVTSSTEATGDGQGPTEHAVVAGDEPARRPGTPQALRWVVLGAALATALGVLVAANMDDRGEGELATGNVTPLGAGTAEQPGDGGDGAPAGPEGSPSPDGQAVDLAALEAAVAQDPGDASLRLALASAAFEQGRADIVREQAEAVLEREPRNVDALMLRGLAAESRRDAEAASALRTFLRLAPADHPAVPLVRTLVEGKP